MVVRSLALCLALTTLPAAAQNNFTITSNGEPAGKASYSIEKTKDGYHVKSKVSYHLSPAATAPPDTDAPPAKGAAPPPLLLDAQQTSSSSRTTNSTRAAVTQAALSLTW
jgi:hypothetical protein